MNGKFHQNTSTKGLTTDMCFVIEWIVTFVTGNSSVPKVLVPSDKHFGIHCMDALAVNLSHIVYLKY